MRLFFAASIALLAALTVEPPDLHGQQQDADTVASLASRAADAWTSDDVDTAVRLYEEVLARDSTHVPALHRVGLVTAWNERYDDALHLLGRAVELSPDRPDIALDRARVLGWARRFDEAIAAVEGVLESDPENLDALRARAQYTSWAGRLDEAAEAYDRLVSRAPDSLAFRIERAQVLAWDERYGDAVSAYRDVLEEHPDHVSALNGLGQTLAWSRRFDEARAAFSRVLEVDPGNRDARRGLGRVDNWSGRFDDGERRWRTLVEEDSTDVQSLVGLAANLNSRGQYRESLAWLDRADALDPDNPQIAELRPLIERALAPSGAPLARYVSDSDGNRNLTLEVGANVPLRNAVELRFGAGRATLEQDGRPELDRRVLRGWAGLSARLGGGWRVAGEVGVWQPDGEGVASRATVQASVSSPPGRDVGVTFSGRATPLDFTALVAENGVQMQEIGIDAAVRAGDGSMGFALSGSRFEGSGVNRRIQASARYTTPLVDWLRTGPSLRGFAYEKEQAELNDGYWSPSTYFIAELPVTFAPGGEQTVRPSLEVAAGAQRIDQEGIDDPWSATVRVEAGLTWTMGPRRQLRLSGVFANSGLQQLSPTGAGDYQYRAVVASLTWAF